MNETPSHPESRLSDWLRKCMPTRRAVCNTMLACSALALAGCVQHGLRETKQFLVEQGMVEPSGQVPVYDFAIPLTDTPEFQGERDNFFQRIRHCLQHNGIQIRTVQGKPIYAGDIAETVANQYREFRVEDEFYSLKGNAALFSLHVQSDLENVADVLMTLGPVATPLVANDALTMLGAASTVARAATEYTANQEAKDLQKNPDEYGHAHALWDAVKAPWIERFAFLTNEAERSAFVERSGEFGLGITLYDPRIHTWDNCVNVRFENAM